jgi:NADH-quinone oxidoreductase subunit L
VVTTVLALIPLLPLLGFVVNATLGRRLSKAVSGGLASAVMIASFAVAAQSVWQLAVLPAEARSIEQVVYTWIASGDLNVALALRLDPLSAVMVLVVTGIGSLIHVYSTAYMHEETDGEFARYFSYLNLFAAFMLVLVLGSSFLVMFVGWEGVGLCSYLLIGFWFGSKSATDAGNKAFIVNRVGDYAFILGMLGLVSMFGTLDFQAVASAVSTLPPETGFGAISLITLLLFIGATGKSAQIPLYTWLPDAMEGPTPVSALIHAATMVTAGVYMIGRNAVLFTHAPETMTIVAAIGVLTAFMAGTIGLVQNDLKRVLAYSTVSQLGYMFLAMGVGAFGAGIFHLYTHAFFKALLFLGSGAVIHALHGEQDIRNMGGLKQGLPMTYWTFLVGAVAISGMPPLAGFFSKDEILFAVAVEGHWLLWGLGMVTALLTATYMFRLVFLTFHGERRSPHPSHQPASDPSRPSHRPASDVLHLHDAPPAMALALVVLAFGSVTAGLVGIPHALGGHNILHAWLEPAFAPPIVDSGAGAAAPLAVAEAASESLERLELTLMAASAGVAAAGIALAFQVWVRRRELAELAARRYAPLHRILLRKYYVDELYDATIVQPVKMVSTEGLWRGFDVRVIDGAVNGTGALVDWASGALRTLQTGSVRAYARSFFIGVVVILGYYLWR